MKRFILVFCAILLGSCCNRSTVSSLRSAEYLISSRPDSALILLRSIDPNDLRSRKSEAKYALLMSAALDKNYIDITSDSLISISVDYYAREGSAKDRMLAWYYHGIVLKNAQDFTRSIISLEKAEKEAKIVGDDFYLGLILRNKGDIYSLTNNNLEAINADQRAIELFNRVGADLYRDYEILALAIDYSNSLDFKTSDSLLTRLMLDSLDSALLSQCIMRKASILVKQDCDPERAIELYRRVPTSFYSFLDYSYLAYAFEMLGQRDSADYWLSKGYAKCCDQPDSATIDYMKSKMELRRGHHEIAYHLVDHAVSVQDSLVRILLQQSVSTAQRDYYKNETLLKESRIRSMRERAIFGVVVSLLIILVLIITVITISRKKDSLLKEQLARLAYEEKELDRLNRDNAHLIGSLFSEKIDRLDQLCESYFKSEDEKQQSLVFKQVKELAAKIREDDGLFTSLEKDLDRYCNGIMAKLRTQVPRIKGENLRIIMLFFAGFSYETVLFILKKNSIESLKTARSRFRKEIIDAQAPNSEFFLKMLVYEKAAAGRHK